MRARTRTLRHRVARSGGLALPALLLVTAAAGAATTELVINPLGEMGGDRFGGAVSRAGDFNGDGYDDVIVGAEYNDFNGPEAGRAYLFFGGPMADPNPDVIFTGLSGGDRLGRVVGTAGDMNGDGYDDVIVGAWSDDNAGALAGAAYVYFGGAAPDSLPDIVIPGAPGDRMGISVGTAGDMNSDGYDDIIVGANAAAGNRGQAYVLFGGVSPDSIPDLRMTGQASGDQFGWSSGTAGDMNGDGYDDVIVGAYNHDEGGTDLGRAYVYFGGAIPDTIVDLILDGSITGEAFGIAVGTAGDVDNDGYDDVIVGGYLSAYAGNNAGRAYIFRGAYGPDAVFDWAAAGEHSGDLFGLTLGTAGDLNKDGYDDVIVGAPNNDMVDTDAGKTYVYYGGPGMDTVADLTFEGEAMGDNFGTQVASAGDFDGNGWNDIIIGAFQAASNGKMYVHSIYAYQLLYPTGSETWVTGDPAAIGWKGTDQADLEISYDGGMSWSTLVTGVGGSLVNNYPLVAPATETELALVRVVYTGQMATSQTSDVSDWYFRIVHPNEPPTAICDQWWTAYGEGAGDGFGSAAGTAGDVNQDGYDDFLAGAPRNGAGGAEAGRAYLYFGGAAPDTMPELVLTGEAPGDRYGHAVGGVGDINMDGHDDFVVGAYHHDAGGSEAGRAYLYLGGTTPGPAPDAIFDGPAALRNLGWSVAGAGDVDGDGYDDLLVGAPGDSLDPSLSGWAYLYFGGAAPDTVSDLILTGEAAGDGFGYSVASAGDFDGNGWDDLIVGAVRAGEGRGRAYLYLGGPGLDATPDFVWTGEAVGDAFGFSVAGVGDMNGDGFDDVIVGAPQNIGESSVGRAYVYFGGPAADELPDIQYTGLWGQFGSALGPSGDINEDGKPDVIVGAPNAQSFNRGEVYVFYGGRGADNLDDRQYYGIVDFAQLGYAVGTAGDMNGDGVSDYFVGRGGVSGLIIWDCGPQGPVGITERTSTPRGLFLAPLSPNPRRSGSGLEAHFALPSGDIVVASLFDVQGRRVTSAEPRRFDEAGEHRIRLDPAQPLRAGIYYLELRTAKGLRAAQSFCVLN